jgi:Ribonuclease G/E
MSPKTTKHLTWASPSNTCNGIYFSLVMETRSKTLKRDIDNTEKTENGNFFSHPDHHRIGKKTRKAFQSLLEQALRDEKEKLKEQPKRLRKKQKSNPNVHLLESEKALIDMTFRLFDKDKYSSTTFILLIL